MINKRIQDIATIYHILTGMSLSKSLSVVKSTATGRAILLAYPDVLYESILNNLYHILCESSSNNLCEFSDSEIKYAYETFEKQKSDLLSISIHEAKTSSSYKLRQKKKANARLMSSLRKQHKKQLYISQEILLKTRRNINAIKRKDQERQLDCKGYFRF